MRRPTVLVFIVALVLAAPACTGGNPATRSGDVAAGSEARDAAARILADGIRAHMTFLADDLLEGRASGSRGYALAARYARAHLEALGLRGGAGDGGWYQPVPMRRGEALAEGSAIVLRGPRGARALRFQDDYLFGDTQAGTEREVTAPVVFAGYGVTAPERNYDDYEGLDARGKIVAILRNAPASFPDTLRAYYAGSDTKQENAAAHGAVGVLGVRSPDDERRFSWEAYIRETRIGGSSLRAIDDAGRPIGLVESLAVQATLSRSGAEALFAGETRDYAGVVAAAQKSAPASFALKKSATLRRRSRHTPVTSDNVVALLEGSDPALRGQYVVYSAHLDHIGIGPVKDGDAIYNGALDNAAGSAVVLEVARAFAALRPPPRRSILFLLVTGEEAGLVGSEWFALHPTVPAESIVADINLDGGAALYPAGDLIAWGEEHSSLKQAVRAAAATEGLDVSPDPFPEETLFIRSDQYSFVRQGVPSVFLDLGLKSLDPEIDGAAVVKKWLVTNYHSPKDDMAQPFHFESSVRLARVAFLVGHRVANDDAPPRWNDGDFFGRRFASGGGGKAAATRP